MEEEFAGFVSFLFDKRYVCVCGHRMKSHHEEGGGKYLGCTLCDCPAFESEDL
jgi:hypothetical protein